ncbi:MAG: F0F1 ATP synthase subunit B [Nevskiaceae bacterium]|nr:MAG: F0F1 ATP synthase subunit B [Nevskiaceae bacterium]
MDINLTLLAQAVVFAAFIWFTARFVWPPLMRVVEERQKTIADGLAAAERGMKSLEDASARSDEALKSARAQAQDILAAANKQAVQIVEQAKATAKAEGDRIVGAAREETQREVAQAKDQLRKQVGELAVAGAAKILKREIDPKAHADVLNELAARV